MRRVYIVKGVNHLGTVVELWLLAPTETDAKRLGEDVGLKFVVVSASSLQVLPPATPDPKMGAS